MDEDTQAHNSDQTQHTDQLPLLLFAKHVNEAAHELLVLLKRAVQSSDDQTVVHLLALLYALYEKTLQYSILKKDKGRILSDEDISKIIHESFLRILQTIKDYKKTPHSGIYWMFDICRNVTYQRIQVGSILPNDLATVHDLEEQEEMIKQARAHLAEETQGAPVRTVVEDDDDQALEGARQISASYSGEALPYITEAERILKEERERKEQEEREREARLLDLEKSPANPVESFPTTPVAGGELPVPTEVDTMRGVEGQPISHPEEAPKTVAEQRAELAQKFTYEDVNKIPPGVDPKQLDFLREATNIGAFEWVKDNTAEMITKYFTSEITQIGLGKEYGITKQAVQERITRGLGKMRRILYRDKPELAEEDTYPLEQIQKGKDETEIFKSEGHKKIRSQAIKAGLQDKNTIRRPGTEKIKKPSADISSKAGRA